MADGRSCTEAAGVAGRRWDDAISKLVWRFNRERLATLKPGHGGGRRATYTASERKRILAAARRAPGCEKDGTATALEGQRSEKPEEIIERLDAGGEDGTGSQRRSSGAASALQDENGLVKSGTIWEDQELARAGPSGD